MLKIIETKADAAIWVCFATPRTKGLERDFIGRVFPTTHQRTFGKCKSSERRERDERGANGRWLPKGWRLRRVRSGFGRGKVKAKGPRKRQEIKVWRSAQPLAAGAIEATRPHVLQPCTNTGQRQRVRAPFDDRDKERKGKPYQSVITLCCNFGQGCQGNNHGCGHL